MRTANVFARWLSENAARLLAAPAAEAADEIGDHILELDDRLGIEVGDPGPDEPQDTPRELVLTAFSDRSAFSLVKEIADTLAAIPGWTIVALKPPRGFEFTTAIGDSELQASTLEFRPTSDDSRAIQLLVPAGLLIHVAVEDQAEIGWLIIEAGIGEELASSLTGVELIARLETSPRWPMSALAGYVAGLISPDR